MSRIIGEASISCPKYGNNSVVIIDYSGYASSTGYKCLSCGWTKEVSSNFRSPLKEGR